MDAVNKQLIKDAVPFWTDMMQHPNRDEFWQKRSILPHLKNVAPAVMVVTGWYDAEDLYGSFKTYHSVESLNPKVNNVLVVGPWHHGGWASVDGDKLGSANFGDGELEVAIPVDGVEREVEVGVEEERWRVVHGSLLQKGG